MGAISDVGRVGVWGRSGSGKSSWVKREIAKARRVVIFDPLGEYQGFKKIPHRTRDGLDQVRAAMAADWAGFRIAYIPPAGQEVAALNGLSRLLLRAQAGYQEGRRGARPMILVVEEMNLAFPVHGGAEKCPGFAEICSRGRHFGIHVIGVSQRLAEVATRFRGNCSETIVFAQKGPRDLAAASAETGRPQAEIAKLENLAFIREKNGATSSGRITFPKKGKNR